MSPLAGFGLGIVAIVVLLGAALLLVVRPLGPVLRELCGTPERGDFWTVLSAITLAVGTLLLGLLGYGWEQFQSTGAATGAGSMLWSGVRMVQWAIVGILLSLAVIATLVVSFTRRMGRGVLPPPTAAAHGESTTA